MYTLNIVDPERNTNISLQLERDEYELAMSDMEYAQKLLDSYYKESVPEAASASHTFVAQSKDSNNREFAVEDALWSEQETLLLISLYEEHVDEFCHAKKKKHVWEIISEKMASCNYNRSASKIERKWINLVRVYKSIKDNKGPKKTGRGAQSYKYFEKLDELLGKKPSNQINSNVIEVGVNKVCAVQEETAVKNSESSVMSTEGSSQESHEYELKPLPTTKTKKRQRKYLHDLEYQKQKQKRHEKRTEVERQKIEVEKEKLEIKKNSRNRDPQLSQF